MQQGRASTIRFNEWICVCAQYEKAIARLGRQVYQGYSRGLITDVAAIDLCKEISQAFSDSKQIRSDMEEELERDALHGLSIEESKAAEEHMELTSSAKMVRGARLKVTKLLGRGAVNRSLQSYRDRVRDLSRDLGLRAVAMYSKTPLLKMDGHMRLCLLAVKLDEDSNKKWQEITQAKNSKGGMDLSFHTMVISFVANFAQFSRGTALGKMLLKLMKYDSKEEEKKLTKQFEGSKTAEALEAQMSEVEEPDLDVGREMETMERDYKEAPTEWGLPASLTADSWVPDTADTWAPDMAETATPAVSPEKPKPAVAAPANAPKPQVLRQRSQVEPLKGAEAWVAGNSEKPPVADIEAEAWTPPAPAGPRIGSTITRAPEPEEDWATSSDDEEDPFEASPSAPRLGGSPGGIGHDPSVRPQIGGGPAARPQSPQAQPASPRPATRPPAEQPSGPAANRPAAQPPGRPAAGIEPSLPPLPPLPARPMRSLDTSTPLPVSPAPSRPSVPVPAPAPPTDDPLLRLLRSEAVSEPKNDDDLLPAFLRERNDDDSLDSSSFIPDLPSDLGLKILPFGGHQSKKTEEDEPDNFIPKMPD